MLTVRVRIISSLQQVRESSLRDIISLRLVCRWFDKVATPVEYQTLVLTKRLLYFRNPERISTAYANITLHTNHVFASIDEIESCHDNHRAVARITTSIQNLLTFTYVRPSYPIWRDQDVMSTTWLMSCKVANLGWLIIQMAICANTVQFCLYLPHCSAISHHPWKSWQATSRNAGLFRECCVPAPRESSKFVSSGNPDRTVGILKDGYPKSTAHD